MSDRDFEYLMDSLALIGLTLVSISVALWMFYLRLDDVTLRVRLVGVALRRWTPLDPRDRADMTTPPAPAAQAKETSSETAHCE